jgi:hypothetical protein
MSAQIRQYSRPEAAALALCVKLLMTLSAQYPPAFNKALELANSDQDKFEDALDQLVQMDGNAQEQLG